MIVGKLSRYLSSQLMVRIMASLAGLVALLLLLAVLDSANDILDRGLGIRGLGYFLWLRLPTAIEQSMTLSMLIGSITTFMQLAKRSEMIIIRAAGITVYQVGLMLLPLLALYAGIHFLISDRVTPQVQRDFALWWQDTTPADEKSDTRTIWLRASTDVVAVESVLNAGSELVNIRVYRRTADGSLINRISAPRALFANGTWTLQGAETLRIDGPRVIREGPADLVWQTQLKPTEVVDIANPLAALASGTIRDILAGEGAVNRSEAYYRTRLNAAYAVPFSSVIMLMLGLACAYGNRRSSGGEKQVLISLGLGLGYIMVNGIMTAFGEAGALPPAFSAWSTLAIFACIAGTILLRFEE